MKNYILAALLFLPACNATDIATAEQKAALQASDQKLAAIQSDMDALQDAYLTSLDEVKALGSQVGTVDIAALQQAASAALSDAEALEEEWRAKVAEWDVEAAAQDAQVGAIIDGASQPFVPFLPPGPAQLAPMLLAFLFDRPRKHAGAAIKHALKGNVADAVKSAAKITGLLHSDSSEQPGYGGPGDTVPK